jgi:hypothetical protein
MTDRKPHSIPGSFATYILLLVLCAQSSAFAKESGFSHDEPWSSERVDRLPLEVRNSVHHMCRAKPTAGHYFATYLNNARIIKLHFEDFSCEGAQRYRRAGGCLHEEFSLSGSHYRLTKNYYGRCND